MLPIAHFLQMIALAVGALAVYIALQLHRAYRFSYLRSHAAMVVGFGILTLSNTVETFIRAAVPDAGRSQVYGRFSALARLVLPLVLLFVAYHFVRVCFGLLRRPHPRWARAAAVVLGCVFIAANGFGKIRPHAVPGLDSFLLIAVNLIFYAAAGAALVYFLAALRNIVSGSERKALRTFGLFGLAFLAVLFLLTVSSVKDWLSPDGSLLALSLVIAVFNPVFVFLFRRYHLVYAVPDGLKFEALADKYRLTPREREIVRLVCAGKSNKEIASALFISSLTARDHLSKIFGKAGVKSRLALAGLFHSGEQGGRST